MRPVRWNVEHDNTVKFLTDRKHSKTGQTLFPTIRGALCFAALIGYETEQTEQVAGESEFLDGRLIFNHAETLETIYAIALADSRSMEIIRPDHEAEMVAIFEGYVNGGLRELAAWFRETPGDIDGVDALLKAVRKREYLDVVVDDLTDQPDTRIQF